MTTKVYLSAYSHLSSAAFRLWGAELSAALAAAGLVNTTDTGQIAWGAATLPGINTAAGYEIWKLPDSSLFIKLEYGTGSSAPFPQLWVTVGEGSNGSGTLTGQLNARTGITNAAGPQSNTINYNTYISVTNDCFSLLWKRGGMPNTTNGHGALLVVGKSVNSSGVATNDGYGVFSFNGTLHVLQSIRRIAPAASYAGSNFFCPPFPAGATANVNTTTGNGNVPQLFLSWLNMPHMVCFPWVVGYTMTEMSENLKITCAPIGGVSRTLLCAGDTGGSTAGFHGLSLRTFSYAIHWE